MVPIVDAAPGRPLYCGSASHRNADRTWSRPRLGHEALGMHDQPIELARAGCVDCTCAG
jgi:hypothetical protein